jgi:hypothetical protein
MSNQCNGDDPFNDIARDREALSSAEFQEFQQTTQQELRQLREMMERMHVGPNRNHGNNDAHDDVGIRVRPINSSPTTCTHKLTTGL